MPVKEFRPITKVQRYKTVLDYSGLSKKGPEKSLLKPYKSKAGRNSDGHITTRHRGSGNKKRFRVIDFYREKLNIPGVVNALEYDPNRSAHIALVFYKDGEKRYIIAPETLKAGQQIMSGADAEIAVGNAMPLSRIPLGMFVHNIEMIRGKGAQIARSAGTYAEIIAKEGNQVHLRMPSGEIRLVAENCFATIGQAGNVDHEKIVIGSAGRNRHMGWRPFVRGMCMNPVDHPNGGGEGRSKSGGGWQQLTSPWSNMLRGQKTRKKKKLSNRLIIKRRKG